MDRYRALYDQWIVELCNQSQAKPKYKQNKTTNLKKPKFDKIYVNLVQIKPILPPLYICVWLHYPPDLADLPWSVLTSGTDN